MDLLDKQSNFRPHDMTDTPQPTLIRRESSLWTGAALAEAQKASEEKDKAIEKTVEKKKEFATLTMPDGKVYQLPIVKSTEGPSAIDVTKLYEATGYFTYDPGFRSTGSCSSAITFIDGPRGILSHRGYRIEELCEHSDFSEVSYLLLYGDLPTRSQKDLHETTIRQHRMIHSKLARFFDGFKTDAHPMAIMVGVVGALSAFHHDSLDISKLEHRAISAYRLIGKMATIAAMAYKTSIGQEFVSPKDHLDYASNLLHMMFATKCAKYKVSPVHAKAMETFLILHADHEQNASTSTVRIAGSSQANPFACIASGITALWGPFHGGANEAVLKMLTEIGSVENIPKTLAKVKDKSFVLMGFGHRVYKNYDPRARAMKEVCEQVLKDLNIADPLLPLAMELEKQALADDYFKQRKLFPNVDFYSGIVLKALGIPVSMFTVLFAVARTVGWVSQWKEMIETTSAIGRPQQVYTGQKIRGYVPMTMRNAAGRASDADTTSVHTA